MEREGNDLHFLTCALNLLESAVLVLRSQIISDLKEATLRAAQHKLGK